MNWIRNKSWLVLTALLLLSAAMIGLAGGLAAAPDPAFPAHAAQLAAAHLGQTDAGPADEVHHDGASREDAHAAGMMDGRPCNAACPVGASGCIPAPVASQAGSLLQRDAGTVCIRHRDDLMLSGLDPDTQPEPPKFIA